MPWKDQSTVQSRVSFIADHAKGLLTMTELCAVYGISRQTGYKWLGRSAACESLADRSRAPHHCPHRTPVELEQAIVAERLKHPHWGPDKIRAVLVERQPSRDWPSSTTMGEILNRHDLITPRRRRRKPGASHHGRRVDAAQPNDVWSSDFKGQFRMGNGQYCYPLTVCDAHSRFLIGCDGLISTAHDAARAVFDRLFREFGLPRVMLTDNGVPFASAQSLSGLSRMSVWWMRLGILPVTIEPGRPQQNGRHERMHRTLKAQTARPPGASFDDQQRMFDAFRQEYNQERPHAALAQRPPAAFYERSPRCMPAKLAEPEYPGHFEVRRVRPNGCMKWRCRDRFLSESLAGQWIGLEEVDDGVWSLYVDAFLIARLHAPTGAIVAAGPAARVSASVALRAPSADTRDHPKCQPCTR